MAINQTGLTSAGRIPTYALCSAERWGMRFALLLMLLLMSTLSPQAKTTLSQAEGSDMEDVPKSMSTQEQEQLFPFFEAALAWASGTRSFDDIVEQFGKPKKYDTPGVNTVDYTYFLGNNVSIKFMFDRLYPVDGQPSIKTALIDIDSLTTTDIPKESYEVRLNLHRVVRGESIDGVRVERGSYFAPRGVLIGGDPDIVDFVYRQPLRPDSPYDVYVTLTYRGEYQHDGPEFRSLQNPRDLRSIEIDRVYLRPEELEQRRLAPSTLSPLTSPPHPPPPRPSATSPPPSTRARSE
ncbi:hypothetical protein [Paraburkholderia antibiotica]|uniref:Uncharacterized protein n=1 Tax=Paraburkholderia antibiotica TaxID=2728839 RepID=A0A7X9X3Z1_9BURK|nr:hypothetical protein [Paraburkholderia antibiotica]NML30992.1 hypothetical protein [Paraburkholderia antibiotica]